MLDVYLHTASLLDYSESSLLQRLESQTTSLCLKTI
jgi:hypothetical protein